MDLEKFQLAIRDKIINNNPSDGVMAEFKKINFKRRSGVRHALTKEQEIAFLDYVSTNEEIVRWKPLFYVLFGTGCRIGEVIGLRWQDIDWDANQISINHCVTYYPRVDNSYKCEFAVSLPKTESGIRKIPMLDKVKEAFKEEREFQQLLGISNSAVVDGMDGFVFCNRFGNLHNPSAVNRAIKRIVDNYNQREAVTAKKERREAILLPRFSCHITRHTFCTMLCENEVNIKVIQKVMGHIDIQTTLDN